MEVAKSGPPPAFINKVLLEHSPMPIARGCFCAIGPDGSSCNRPYDPPKPGNTYSLALGRKSLLTPDNDSSFLEMFHL